MVGYVFYFTGSGAFYSFFFGSFFAGSSAGGAFFFIPINLAFTSLYLGTNFYPLKFISRTFSEFLRTYDYKIAIYKGYFNIFLTCSYSKGIDPDFIRFSTSSPNYANL